MAIVAQFAIFLAFIAAPFVLYRLAKRLWPTLVQRSVISDITVYTMRKANIVFQIFMAVTFVMVMYFIKHSSQYYIGQSRPVLISFWLCYFLWPISSAIYVHTKRKKWEWVTYWSTALCMMPLLLLLLGQEAE